MQFDNQKTRNVADVAARIMAGESVKEEPQMLEEELVGNQHKIDANKNKKIDAHDFKLLRAQKDKEKANSQKFGKDVKEEVEELDEGIHKEIAKYAMDNYSSYDKKPGRYEIQKARGYIKNPTGKKIDYDKVQQHVDTMHKQRFGKDVKEETELAESHFKVGDKVKCKTSGMKGEVVKLDKEEGGEDEKYYTIKREDGEMKKMAPNELTKINEEAEELDELSKDSYKNYLSTSKKLVGDHAKGSQLSRYGEYGAKDRELNTKNAQKHAMKKLKEEEIDEAMFPGTKEYEKKFGQSPQQKLKKKGDTVPTSQGEMKKTEKGVVHTRRFSEMVSAYQEQGLKFVASLVKEEPTQDEYDKEIKKAQNKSEGKEKAEVAKASVQAVKNEETHTKVQFIDMTDPDNIKKSEIDLEERSLTEPEMKKKEEYVKGMKKKMPGFKERYGERAKEVMYATATKMAKKD
jgi:hypothetical protein